MTNETNSRELLWDLIKDIRFAMFTTANNDGHLHSRPMTTQNKKLDEGDKLWFFMSRRGEPVLEFKADAQINVAYADTGADNYVSVSGTARISDDKAKTRELWSKMAEAWFPGGVDDPDLALVEVTINHAHFWNVKESKVTQLYKMAKAVVTGKPPLDLGRTGDVRLH